VPLCVAAKSQIAGQACAYISQLYEIEREVKTLGADERLQIRQARSKPLADKFHAWMLLQRRQVTDGTATAKALDYSLKRWTTLTQFLGTGKLPIDNNLHREPDSPDCHWSQQLVVRRLLAGRTARCCGDEFDSERQAQRA